MAVSYTKQFLIDAFLHRFREAGMPVDSLESMAIAFYDEVGKDKFRMYASLDAYTVKQYKDYVKDGKSYPRRFPQL